MKKIVPIILMALIAIAGYWVVQQSTTENSNTDIRQFAIDDPNVITRIELKDRNGRQVTLHKKNDTWYVNNQLLAFGPKIQALLFKTLNKIRIKGPVPKTAQKNVIRQMVGHATHVQIFDQNKKIRDYYVGASNPDRSATYIHINGSNTPYLAHILGYANVLEPKFSTQKYDWINQTIFDFTPDQIAYVSVTHHNDTEESFTLSKTDSLFQISPSIPQLSQSAARSYFSLFSFKNFEGYATYLNASQKDSIKKASPFMSIKVVPKQGDPITLNLHQKGLSQSKNSLYDKRGQPIVEDTERYFATFTDFPYLVTVQHFTMGKLLVKRSYFKP